MIFTSEAGSDGIIDYEWVGKDFSVDLDPNEEFEYDININIKEQNLEKDLTNKEHDKSVYIGYAF